MSRSRHHGCGRDCGCCSPDAIEQLKVRAAKAPTVDEFDRELPCPDCFEIGCQGCDCYTPAS